jgi:putative hemolysin
MQTAAPPIPISLLPMLPAALRQWAQPLEPALLVPGKVTDGFDLARRKGTTNGFAQHLLDALDINFKTDVCDRKRIPVSGSAVIVANHPGIVEGLILAALLDQVRPDWKIMVNSILASIAETQVSLTFALRR